ncbi:methyl-accepting chemotaxis protein [Myxococcus sp. AB056]|uniref:methyl-accepting chemotaxis protein n=1 Tax=Myxococcus sp. AB056 TaxID=2562792 RepID=UPI001147213B|nr:methyl-accepting chemotaxis protein [Myxococcus sp. AB056]
MNVSLDADVLERRSQSLFDAHQEALSRRTDRMFAVLMGLQWVGGLVVALALSPRTWSGTSSQVHPHVWAAAGLGALLASLPVAMAWALPGRAATRFVIATAQALVSGLLIHLTDGRIETHFHIFGSLALLAMYRDARVLFLYSALVAVDHLLRGLYWPLSIFGVESASAWRAWEHIGWVVFENVFLLIGGRGTVKDARALAARQAWLELSQGAVRTRVVEPLVDSARALTEATHSLVSSTDDQRAMLSRQSAALSDTQMATNEMQRASSTASRQADAILASTLQAGDVGADAEAMLGQSMEGLEAIRTQVMEMAGLLRGLDGQARQLSSVTLAVKDLADQSHMVAVNAAIEAARAGAHGKGFAVVATEMRRLAQQSVRAAGQVSGILDAVHQSLQHVVELSLKGADRMARDIEVVRASGERLRGLSTVLRTSTEGVQQISVAVARQAAGVARISSAVDELSAMMKQTLGRVEQTTTAAQTLRGVTGRVHGVIDTYQGTRTDEAPPANDAGRVIAFRRDA